MKSLAYFCFVIVHKIIHLTARNDIPNKSWHEIIIIIIIINCNWVVTRWQLLFYMYTIHEISY